MKIGEAVNTIIRCWRELTIGESNGPATDCSRDIVSGSKPGTKRPPDYGSAAERIKSRLVALAKIAEAEVTGTLSGLGQPYGRGGSSHHPVRSETKKAILSEEGAPAAELAFLLRATEDHVKRVRREAGRDPETGERLRADERPITEPPANTLRRRHADANDS